MLNAKGGNVQAAHLTLEPVMPPVKAIEQAEDAALRLFWQRIGIEPQCCVKPSHRLRWRNLHSRVYVRARVRGRAWTGGDGARQMLHLNELVLVMAWFLQAWI